MTNLYFVQEGEVSEVFGPVEFDSVESVLALADTAEDALALATAYDAGMITIGNHIFDGKTIACLADYH